MIKFKSSMTSNLPFWMRPIFAHLTLMALFFFHGAPAKCLARENRKKVY